MVDSKLQEKIEAAVAHLNSIPWWRPLKRQEASRTYRYLLFRAAMVEARESKRR